MTSKIILLGLVVITVVFVAGAFTSAIWIDAADFLLIKNSSYASMIICTKRII